MAELIQVNDWTLRVQLPEGPGPHPCILMLHGLSGDEDVMWVFAARLPKHACLIAPRALYPSKLGGYSWVAEGGAGGREARLTTADFRPALEGLSDLLRAVRTTAAEDFPNVQTDRIGLVGFSQGAALAYSLALTQPERVSALAGLAGFAPDDAAERAAGQPLAGKTVFMAHGTRDKTVPFERAQEARRAFEAAGAQVILCSDDVGHKLSANCFRGLAGYFAEQYGLDAAKP